MSGGFKLKVVISGMSGLVGSKLKDMFLSRKCEVLGLKIREATSADEIATQLEGCDILINLSGASILGRWSKSYKNKLYNSRINTTKKLVDAISKCTEKPKLLISASAVGIYDSEAKHDDDSVEYADDFLANLCKDWESQARRAEEFGVRSVQTRFGVIYAKEDGAMQKMLPPFKMGLGGKLGEGHQIISWIHIDDLVRAYEFIIKTPSIKGAVNLTTKHTLSNIEQTRIMGKLLHRLTIFPVPAFVLKLIFSEGSIVMLDSKDVYPRKLLENGFEFRYSRFEDAFEEIIS